MVDTAFNFPTVARWRADRGLTNATPHDHLVIVADFGVTHRDRANMAMLREHIEEQYQSVLRIAEPVKVFDLQEAKTLAVVGYMFTVDPGVDLLFVSENLELIHETGVFNDEGMTMALEAEVLRRWVEADLMQRLKWIEEAVNDTGDEIDADAPLQAGPPLPVYDLIERNIDD